MTDWIQYFNMYTITNTMLYALHYLNLVKVLPSFKWHNVVCRDSYHRFIGGILCCVKCQCSFSRHNLKNQALRSIKNERKGYMRSQIYRTVEKAIKLKNGLTWTFMLLV